MKERVPFSGFRHLRVATYAASPRLPAHASRPQDSLKYLPRISLKRVFLQVAPAVCIEFRGGGGSLQRCHCERSEAISSSKQRRLLSRGTRDFLLAMPEPATCHLITEGLPARVTGMNVRSKTVTLMERFLQEGPPRFFPFENKLVLASLFQGGNVDNSAELCVKPQVNKAARAVKLIVLIVIICALVTALWLLPLKQYMVAVLEWTQGLGAWGPVFVVAFYVVATVFFLPGSVLTLGAGFLFGVPLGLATAWTGAVVGACAAFLVGRTFAA